MKNQSSIREAFDEMIVEGKYHKSGYRISIREFGDELILHFIRPNNTDWAVFPHIAMSNEWYLFRLKIMPDIYDDNSIREAKRIRAGLDYAIDLCMNLYTIAIQHGLPTK